MAQLAIELILLRQWASYLVLPVFIADADGKLLFFNEPAEELLGRRFDELGDVPLQSLAEIFVTTDESGAPISRTKHPLGAALLRRQPAHKRLRIRGADGVTRLIEATAFPIQGQEGRFLGAVAMFWEARSR